MPGIIEGHYAPAARKKAKAVKRGPGRPPLLLPHTRVTFRAPSELWKKMKELSGRWNRSINLLFCAAAQAALDGQDFDFAYVAKYAVRLGLGRPLLRQPSYRKL